MSLLPGMTVGMATLASQDVPVLIFGESHFFFFFFSIVNFLSGSCMLACGAFFFPSMLVLSLIFLERFTVSSIRKDKPLVVEVFHHTHLL